MVKNVAIPLAVVVAMSMTAAATSAARAEYPEKPIKVIVATSAGGFVDGVARLVTDRMSAILGKPMVIENRPGASSKIGEDAVAEAAPDGYTLLVTGSIMRPVLSAAVQGTTERDMLKDFDVIGSGGTALVLMAVPTSLGVKDFKGLIDKMKAEPKKHSYGSAGTGSPGHILSAQLVQALNLDVVHVPYRGGAPLSTDLAAGIVAFGNGTPSGSLALIQAGKVIPVMIHSPARLKQMPDVPTSTELGLPQLSGQQLSVFFMAPKGTPRPILEKLNAVLIEAHKDARVQARLDTESLVPPPPNTGVDASHRMAEAEIKSWQDAVKAVPLR